MKYYVCRLSFDGTIYCALLDSADELFSFLRECSSNKYFRSIVYSEYYPNGEFGDFEYVICNEEVRL